MWLRLTCVASGFCNTLHSLHPAVQDLLALAARAGRCERRRAALALRLGAARRSWCAARRSAVRQRWSSASRSCQVVPHRAVDLTRGCAGRSSALTPAGLQRAQQSCLLALHWGVVWVRQPRAALARKGGSHPVVWRLSETLQLRHARRQTARQAHSQHIAECSLSILDLWTVPSSVHWQLAAEHIACRPACSNQCGMQRSERTKAALPGASAPSPLVGAASTQPEATGCAQARQYAGICSMRVTQGARRCS